MKKLAVLTGAGISTESGLKTFRDANGLWEGHDVTKVASPEGWKADRKLVLEFYNQRRKQVLTAEPNAAHTTLADLEQYFEVVIITQNVDNLHERAGSSQVLHLHGELFKARSTIDPSLVYDIEGWELNEGDLCEKGSQLRPHIVWFGEMVPMMDRAIPEIRDADVVLVVGTSLVVYPAAGLLHDAMPGTPVFLVDPHRPDIHRAGIRFIQKPATEGVPQVARTLIKDFT